MRTLIIIIGGVLSDFAVALLILGRVIAGSFFTLLAVLAGIAGAIAGFMLASWLINTAQFPVSEAAATLIRCLSAIIWGFGMAAGVWRWLNDAFRGRNG
jgi:hypothetical protein